MGTIHLEIEGKTALITGGSKGIGLAIAKGLGNEGCEIIICSRSLKNLEAAFHELPQNHTRYEVFDALITSDVARIANHYKDSVDILINNVGGGGRWGTPTPWETPEYTWNEVYMKNAEVAIRLTNAFVPHMIERGWGRVVCIISIYGREAGGRPWFNMAKAAEMSLMKSMAKNIHAVRHGVTFNSIAGGHISVPGKPDEENLEIFPMGRMGRTEEIADVVTFVCSNRANFVNGACWVVDGGESYGF